MARPRTSRGLGDTVRRLPLSGSAAIAAHRRLCIYSWFGGFLLSGFRRWGGTGRAHSQQQMRRLRPTRRELLKLYSSICTHRYSHSNHPSVLLHGLKHRSAFTPSPPPRPPRPHRAAPADRRPGPRPGWGTLPRRRGRWDTPPSSPPAPPAPFLSCLRVKISKARESPAPADRQEGQAPPGYRRRSPPPAARKDGPPPLW